MWQFRYPKTFSHIILYYSLDKGFALRVKWPGLLVAKSHTGSPHPASQP